MPYIDTFEPGTTTGTVPGTPGTVPALCRHCKSQADVQKTKNSAGSAGKFAFSYFSCMGKKKREEKEKEKKRKRI